MNINIKATNIDLDLKTKEYVEEKIMAVDKFIPSNDVVQVFVKIGKESNRRQNAPDQFMAEVRFNYEGNNFYIKDYATELFPAIDLVQEEMKRQVKENKEKSQTLFVRGARKIKKRIKGMKPWWPFANKERK